MAGPLVGGAMTAGKIDRFSVEASQFFRRIGAQTDARYQLYATMIDSLATNGIFAKLDLLQVFAADTQANAVVNIIQPAYLLTNNGGNTFTADYGFTIGTGAGQNLMTNFNPITAVAPKFVQNDASYGAWSDVTAALGKGLMKADNLIQNVLYGRFTDDFQYGRVNAGVDFNVASTDGKGFWSGSRTASNLTTFYKNAVSLGTTATASTVPDNAVIILGADASTGPAAAHKILACYLGGGLTQTETTNLYNAIHSYLQTVAGIA